MYINYFGELVSNTKTQSTTNANDPAFLRAGSPVKPPSMTPIGEILKDLDLNTDKFKLSDPFDFLGVNTVRPAHA